MLLVPTVITFVSFNFIEAHAFLMNILKKPSEKETHVIKAMKGQFSNQFGA